MANYISALNGEQMDAALTDVALHNSEAWAVGTRNTIPVSSSDETYHNNAKYYAQVAQSAIPGTYTAAVRWDIDQGLAGEAQEQARANISAGASNRNLLDNPFFTVNQRGSATYTLTGNAYIVDRWKSSGGNTITVSSNGISMASSTGTHQNLLQGMTTEAFNGIAGKVLTASVLTQSGALSTLTFTMPSSIASGSLANLGSMSIGGASFVLYFGHAYSGLTTEYTFWLYSTTTAATVAYRAVKLELGSYSTLINDTPPDYESEKRKCMAYFQRIQQKNSYTTDVGYGEMIASANNARITIPTAVPMRYVSTGITAAPTTVGNMYVVGNGQALVASAVSGLGVTDNGVVVNVTVSGTLTANQIYALRFTNNSTYLDLSVEP